MRFLQKLFRRAPERAIYRYADGQRERGADPIAVIRKLSGHETFNADTHLPLALKDPPDPQALEKTLSAAREVFGLEPYDDRTERGLTDAEALQVLLGFCDFLGQLKKNTSGPPTSPPATEAACSESSTTKPASPSGS